MAGSDSVSGNIETPMSADSTTKRSNGGWITFPFMIVTFFGLTMASSGWILNLIVFLIQEFNMKSIAAAQISNIVSGCIAMIPAIGAIAADSFFGTIPVISISAFISLLGVSLLSLTASLESLRPLPCETSSVLCQSPSKLQLAVLYTAITLASIGAGGMRFTLATAGANQFEKPKDQARFFDWFFFTMYLAGAISATAIVYIEDNISWSLGFGLCVAANLVSFLVFIGGKRFYRHDKPLGSPFTSLLQVIFASIYKRKALISTNEKDYYCESTTLMLTKSFRFFNRAALKQENDVQPNGEICNPWRLCSVQQVEDFKALIKITPLVLATLFLTTPITMLLSLTVLQGLVMDRSLGSHFKIPAGSLQVILILSTCLFLTINDRFLYPVYQKITGKSLTLLQRVGIGHAFNILGMAMTALVEAKRLKIVENGHLLDSSVADMSVLWLFPPLVVAGIGEAFHFPANVALCYQEFPESLKSLATSITSVFISICFYIATALIDLIQRITSWLPDDINHGRVDNVYWVLAIGGILNLGYFLVCSWIYKYRNLKDDDEKESESGSTTFSS